MKSGAWRYLGVVAVVAALQLSGAVVGLAETVDKSFAVRPGGTLTVDADIGSIDVQVGSNSAVDAHVTTSGARASNVSVSFETAGDSVSVRCRYDRDWFLAWAGGPKVRLEIKVPRHYNVDLKTAGGSISVADLDGRVLSKTSGGSLSFGTIHGTVEGATSGGSIGLVGCSGDANLATSGGSIHVGEVGGPAKLRTSGGSITVDHARSRLDAHTSGGSVHLGEVMGAVNASTSGGSIDAFISKQPTDDCRLTTSGGGVNVVLADGLRFDVSARGNGVHSDFQLSGGSTTRHSLSGQLNGGGPALDLRTSGGSARLRSK